MAPLAPLATPIHPIQCFCIDFALATQPRKDDAYNINFNKTENYFKFFFKKQILFRFYFLTFQR